jgi:hypothetical protein
MAFSSDGRLHASSCKSQKIILWRLETAEAVATFIFNYTRTYISGPLIPAGILRRVATTTTTTTMLADSARQSQLVGLDTFSGYSPPVFEMGQWLVCRHQRAIRLPPQYFALHVIVYESTIALGLKNNRVIVIGFDESLLPKKPSSIPPLHIIKRFPLAPRSTSEGLSVPYNQSLQTHFPQFVRQNVQTLCEMSFPARQVLRERLGEEIDLVDISKK